MNDNQADVVIIDLHYLPCVEYFAKILNSNKVFVEINEHYIKQTYRNRCYVQISNKVQSLTVPVIKGTGKVKIKDVKIEYRQRWQDNHWRTITSAYGNAPFFDFLVCEFHDILYKKYQFLVDLNLDLLTKCLDLLGMGDKQIILTNDYEKQPESQIIDFRNTIGPKKGSTDDHFFRPLPYNQIFGKDFVPNLSVIDLLFCEGSRAKYVISQSISYLS